jgi:hypothetical protein
VEAIWVVVGGALWLVSGNAIVGLPWLSGFRPFKYRYLRGLSWVEWLAVALLAVISLAIMGLGLRS